MSLKNYILKLAIDGLSAAGLLERGRNHVTMLEDNATYPTLQAQLPDFTAANDKLEAANAAVLFNGGKIAFEERRIAVEAVTAFITNIGRQVQLISEGDKAKILSAGFEVRKDPEPVTFLEQPQDLKARNTGAEGQAVLDWNGVPGAAYFKTWMTAGDPSLNTGWVLVATTTKSRTLVEGLEFGKTYTFRVKAIGTRVESLFSANAMLRAA